MTHDAPDVQCTSSPFEGPEKLLEIWFAPSVADLPDAGAEDGRSGLRKVKREIWEEMLDIVKCKVLSYVEGKEIDAYLLRCASSSSRSMSARLTPGLLQRIIVTRISAPSDTQNVWDHTQPARSSAHS